MGSVSGLAVKGLEALAALSGGELKAAKWIVDFGACSCWRVGPEIPFCRRVILAMSIAGILNLTA